MAPQSVLRKVYNRLPRQIQHLVPSQLDVIAQIEECIETRIRTSKFEASCDLAISNIYESDVLPSPMIRYLDIGARYGPKSNVKIFDELGVLRLTGIEPDGEEIKKLNQKYPTGNFFQVALSNSEGEQTLYVTNHWSKSSLYKPNRELINRFDIYEDAFEIQKEVQIETTTLDNFYKNRSQEYDLIKIDTQGSEGDIISEGDEALSQSLAIEFETHFKPMYEGQTLFYEIHQMLSDLDLTIIDVSTGDGYVRWARNGRTTPPMRDGEIIEHNPLYMRLDVQSKISVVKLIAISLVYRRLHIAHHIFDKHSDLFPKQESEELKDILDNIPNYL